MVRAEGTLPGRSEGTSSGQRESDVGTTPFRSASAVSNEATVLEEGRGG
jgi:hypothetical protein